MKQIVIIALILGILAVGMPAFANTRQENNANIADFILDTIKLPLVLVGSFVNLDHDKAVEETQYKKHEGLKKTIRRSD